MQRRKLTIRVEQDLLDRAKRYASEHDTNLTRLINEYLRQVTTEQEFLKNAPITKRLSGTLSPDASVDHYKKYLVENYGRQD